ncbi:flavin reductase [Micromonospora sp. NPDC000442]|uniref:flavin reductase n=1 Tax=Micromonospora sp. NPDC000442 TaxID=3364217 RepID=UPI003687B924
MPVSIALTWDGTPRVTPGVYLLTREASPQFARPWRCRACGIAWPCSAAKLRLLAEYRGNTPGLMVYLVTLREEAIEQLARLNLGTHLPDLHKRFTDWVPDRSH